MGWDIVGARPARHPDATALRWLRKRLWRYAVLAGWVSELEHAA
jgi:hypothetical protein